MPLKMQSAIRSARRDLWLCSPSTQEMASTMFDLPHPLGPMMQLRPVPPNVRLRLFTKGLEANEFDLAEFEQVVPLYSATSRQIGETSADTCSISSRGRDTRQQLWRVL